MGSVHDKYTISEAERGCMPCFVVKKKSNNFGVTEPAENCLHCEYCDTYLVEQQLDKYGCCPNCSALIKESRW